MTVDWHKISVSVTNLAQEESKVRSQAEETAWELASHAAADAGIDLGSEKFEKIYVRLRDGLYDCADAHSHLRFIAMATVRAILKSSVALVSPTLKDDDMEDFVNELIAIVFGMLTVTYASGPDGWLKQSEWEQLSDRDRTMDIDFTVAVITPEGTK